MIKRCDYCDTKALSPVIVCGSCGAPFPCPRLIGTEWVFDREILAMIDESERKRMEILRAFWEGGFGRAIGFRFP